MNRRLIGLLVSVALAAAGTVVLVSYVRSAEARALEGERLVDVYVVVDRIEAGTKGSDVAEAVRSEQVPVKVRATGAVTRLRDIEALVADVHLLPGEQLLRERFVTPDVAQRGDVPPGMHEVTLSLEPARALGGRLVPGHTVGVIASFDSGGEAGEVSALILHKVLVTTVQLQAAAFDEAKDSDGEKIFPEGNLLVTVAVDAPAAERLVFAAEHGRVWLTSEPSDAPEAGAGVQTYGTVLP